MLGTIYTSLSGMQAFRTGLDVISNNVANMNTPGFKTSDATFRDLVQQQGGALSDGSNGGGVRGAGVEAGKSSLIFQQGDNRETKNPLDAAIQGAGFFVFDMNGQQIYTRAGQMEFDRDGFLVDRDTKARVYVSTSEAGVGFLDLNTVRTFAPRATSEVKLSGTLGRGGTATSYEIPKITLNDTSGATMDVRAKFTRDSADAQHWTLEILDSENAVLGSGDVRFNADGTPATDGNTVSISLTPKNSTSAFTVAFTIGTANSFNGVSSVSGTQSSALQVLHQDGLALGTITATKFDEHGQLKVTYSNGEEKVAASLLLARFDTPDELTQLGGSRFAVAGDSKPVLGTALSDGFGSIEGGKIEMSNVDLTTEFAVLIVTQRGFQGSSQIASAANEMMQQLLAMGTGR